MAELKPVVICLSRSGQATAFSVAAALGAPVHGREGRCDRADAYFPNALDHVRMLFQAGHPVIGVCAAGILVRAVAPVLADKRSEPPVIAIPDDGSTVIPLLGGHNGDQNADSIVDTDQNGTGSLASNAACFHSDCATA